MPSPAMQPTALQGLKGFKTAPQETGQLMDEGVLEAKANPIDSRHGHYGHQEVEARSGIYPGHHSRFANFTIYDGSATGDYQDTGYEAAGEPLDETPVTHGGRWARGINQISWKDPDGYARNGEEMSYIHGEDHGAPKLFNLWNPAGREEKTNYTTDRYESPDNHVLSDIPEQLKGVGSLQGHGGPGGYGAGGADVVQGYGKNNETPEFAHGHSIRRVQHDSLHFDFTNTHGEQDTPFLGRHPIQQMPLDGPDSPYFTAGDIDRANVVWEGRMGDPTEYVQPPEVTVLQDSSSPSNDVWAWS